MSILLAVANQKGGCGKTTTVMNLAGALTRAKYRVRVIDADPQASATLWSLARGQDSLPFDVVPARQFKGRLPALASDEYDITLVDCPPGVVDGEDAAYQFARAVIRGADAILVPLRPGPVDFAASAAFVRYLEKQKHPATKTAVFINGRQHTLLGRQATAQAAVLFAPIVGAVVLETSIGLRTQITEVMGSGQTIFEYAPKHEAVHEYIQLIKEILQWLAPAQESTLQNSQPSTHTLPLPESGASL